MGPGMRAGALESRPQTAARCWQAPGRAVHAKGLSSEGDATLSTHQMPPNGKHQDATPFSAVTVVSTQLRRSELASPGHHHHHLQNSSVVPNWSSGPIKHGSPPSTSCLILTPGTSRRWDPTAPSSWDQLSPLRRPIHAVAGVRASFVQPGNVPLYGQTAFCSPQDEESYCVGVVSQ